MMKDLKTVELYFMYQLVQNQHEMNLKKCANDILSNVTWTPCRRLPASKSMDGIE